jgi:hypothetical protein
VREREG